MKYGIDNNPFKFRFDLVKFIDYTIYTALNLDCGLIFDATYM